MLSARAWENIRGRELSFRRQITEKSTTLNLDNNRPRNEPRQHKPENGEREQIKPIKGYLGQSSNRSRASKREESAKEIERATTRRTETPQSFHHLRNATKSAFRRTKVSIDMSDSPIHPASLRSNRFLRQVLVLLLVTRRVLERFPPSDFDDVEGGESGTEEYEDKRKDMQR